MAEWILDISDPFYEDNLRDPFRARSHTWPLPPASLSVKSEEDGGLSDPNNNNNISLSGGEVSSGEIKPNGNGSDSNGQKKNSSRRNAWGNMSYADLITQAIQSSSEKRLTLSQIYDWMVQNVPYFKDKGDSNSSAGWKNSIRHNLSLHNRFKRVQNEGTGKSSWWVINPEAKPGKAARRRAASMETQKYEKKRGRIKKKVEALRNGVILDDKPSPGSSVSEGLDLFPDSPLHQFQLSPDFRPRASSNASSCGRLSPIIIESDIHDDQFKMDTNDQFPLVELSADETAIILDKVSKISTKETIDQEESSVPVDDYNRFFDSCSFDSCSTDKANVPTCYNYTSSVNVEDESKSRKGRASDSISYDTIRDNFFYL